jgi:hypothetical protein
MLVNLTNHPVSTWNKSQLEAAAEQFGMAVDWPFPSIPPESDENTVYQMAVSVVNEVISTYGYNITVHIMGEQTFCCYAIKEFDTRGIKCVASTTSRNVYLNENGDKLTHFDFVRFRYYNEYTSR